MRRTNMVQCSRKVLYFYPVSPTELTYLHLGLRRLEGRYQEIPNISCSFVEVKAHPLITESLRNNVELNAIEMSARFSTKCDGK